MPQKQALDRYPEQTHRERREDERAPVVHPQKLQAHIGGKRAEHVEGPMREIDDPHEPEDYRETEAQQRVERSIDQSQHELAQNRGQRHAEDGCHESRTSAASRGYFFASTQAGSGCDPSASSPDMTLITL